MTDIISNNNKSLRLHRRVKLVQYNSSSSSRMSMDTVAPLPFINHVPALKSSLKKHSYKSPVTKSVHFDRQLEYIQHFHSPPPSDEEEEEGALIDTEEEDDDDDDEENKLEDEFLELFWNNNKFLNNTNTNCKQQHGITTMSLLNLPSTIHPTRRFISQMVSLESIVWDNAKCVAQGRVLVHNISYEKKVTVRYTLDNWNTWKEIEAVYKESAFNNSGINNSALDRFEFYVSLPESTTCCCSLAVRYETNGQEFWDNNNQENFSLRLTPLTESSSSHDIYNLPSRLHELYLAAATHKNFLKPSKNKPTSFHHHHDVLLIKNSSAPPYLSV